MQARPDPSEIVSTSEAALILGVNVATINRWTLTGRLRPAFQGAGKTSPRFFWRADIEQENDKVRAERETSDHVTPEEEAVVAAARRLSATVPPDWRGTLRPPFAALLYAVDELDQAVARHPSNGHR